MQSEEIREWVEQKLNDGVEKEKIKYSLESNDHDPSIVDEIAEEEATGGEPVAGGTGTEDVSNDDFDWGFSSESEKLKNVAESHEDKVEKDIHREELLGLSKLGKDDIAAVVFSTILLSVSLFLFYATHLA